MMAWTVPYYLLVEFGVLQFCGRHGSGRVHGCSPSSFFSVVIGTFKC